MCRFLSRNKLNSETDKKVSFLTHDDPSGSLRPFHTQYQFLRFLKREHLSTRMTPPPLCHLTPNPIRLRYCNQQTRSFSFLSSVFLYHILYSCSSFAFFLFLRKGLPLPIYFSAKSYLDLALVLGASSLQHLSSSLAWMVHPAGLQQKKGIGNNDVDDDVEDGDDDDRKLLGTVRSVK